MTNSHPEGRADAIIDELMELMDGERMAREIDVSIDRCLVRCRGTVRGPVSRDAFHDAISGLIRCVYEQGLGVAQRLSPREACAEAIAILESGYPNAGGSGYDVAFLDASDPQRNGLESVLEYLAEELRARERQKHFSWVFAGYGGLPQARPARSHCIRQLHQHPPVWRTSA